MIGILKKIKKEESGASMVVVVLCMIVIFGFTAFAVDLGNAYKTKVEMQDACDLSALAAANALPEKTKTEQLAKEYAELNGFSKDDVSVDILENGEQVEVKIAQDVDTYFAGVIGFDKVPVNCRAVAAAGGNGAKDYAIFSGTTAFFGLHGNVNIPVGDIHANGPGDITGTLNIKDGVIEVPKFNNQGATGDYETYVDSDNHIEMPDYSDIITSKMPNLAGDGYVEISGDFVSSEYVKSHTVNKVLTIDENVCFKGHLNIGTWSGIDEIVINGTLKVEQGADFDLRTVINGNLVVAKQIGFRGVTTDISGTVVAGGTINFSKEVRLNEAIVVCDSGQIEFQGATVTDMYSDSGYSVFWGRGANTNININATMDTKTLLYAPNGETIMDGGNVNIKGSITSNQVGTNNGNLTVELPKDDDKWEFGGRTGAGKRKKSAKLIG